MTVSILTFISFFFFKFDTDLLQLKTEGTDFHENNNLPKLKYLLSLL